MPLLRKQQPILHATAALQHPLIIRIPVTLTHDIRSAQLELRRQRCVAGPLDILLVIFSITAQICAVHLLDVVEITYFGWTGAVELWDCRDAAGGGLAVSPQVYGVDVGEEDGIFARWGGGEGYGGEESKEQGVHVGDLVKRSGGKRKCPIVSPTDKR